MKQRGLQLNKDKSVCIIMGSKKQKQEASKEIQENPLECGDFETKEQQVEKWLGQFLSSAGLADSVTKTVTARIGKIKGTSLEIAQIVNDWRSQVVGGIESAILLWEACCIPSLLHGAGTWVEMSDQTEQTLNSLQQWFIRLILQVGPGTPLASLLWDLGMLDMGLRIWLEKLMLVLHARRLGDETLARRVYEEQKVNNWPGLVEETESICRELSIESVHVTELSSRAYRAQVLKACHLKNEVRLRAQAEGKIKCERITTEIYGKKEYISRGELPHVRQLFRTRFGMMHFAGNYGKDRRFARTDWLCKCREAREEEAHLISGNCEVYGEIRKKYDILDDNNLVHFFNDVLKRRDDLDNEER